MLRPSYHQRPDFIKEIQNETFDLIVIGGGITGAGIALDATTRGLKTLLVEKRDFAWGTSSRSTKLIHGGLRYLKQFEFGLVHEVGVERAVVYNNARHVVIPERMLLPIVEDGSLGKRLSSFGLWIYDRLAQVKKEERRQMLDKEETLASEPLLRDDIVLGGGLYYEYRTDDARLTIEVIKTAVELGAKCINYTAVTDFIYRDNGYVRGVKVKDELSGEEYTLTSRRIVNAAGPWVDTLREKDTEGVQKKHLYLTKGVHLVVPYERLPVQQSVYFDVDGDSRMVFAIPRFGVTYIGTTDTAYNEDISRPVASLEDIEYILSATNKMFPNADLTVNDVESTWAGLRPLIHQEGKSPSELSRKDEIFVSETGLISIAGGKLTGYRKMAERIVNLVCKTMRIKRPCETKELQLIGGKFDSQEAFDSFVESRIGEAGQIETKPDTILQMARRYGNQLDVVIDKAYELYPQYQDAELLIVAAELWYGIHHEMVNNLCDFFIRRTGRLYFSRPSLEKLYPFVADKMAEWLDWSEEHKLKEMAAFEKEYHEVIHFKQQSQSADMK